jgi:hypothetical protein
VGSAAQNDLIPITASILAPGTDSRTGFSFGRATVAGMPRNSKRLRVALAEPPSGAAT